MWGGDNTAAQDDGATSKNLGADERLLCVQLRPAAHPALCQPAHNRLSDQVAVVLRLHLDPRACPSTERILKAAQAEKPGFGASGDAEQFEGEPPAVVAAFHVLAVPGGLAGYAEMPMRKRRGLTRGERIEMVTTCT